MSDSRHSGRHAKQEEELHKRPREPAGSRAALPPDQAVPTEAVTPRQLRRRRQNASRQERKELPAPPPTRPSSGTSRNATPASMSPADVLSDGRHDHLTMTLRRPHTGQKWPFLVYRSRFPVCVGLVKEPTESAPGAPSATVSDGELRKDDRIVGINGVAPTSHDHAVKLFAEAGTAMVLDVLREKTATDLPPPLSLPSRSPVPLRTKSYVPVVTNTAGEPPNSDFFVQDLVPSASDETVSHKRGRDEDTTTQATNASGLGLPLPPPDRGGRLRESSRERDANAKEDGTSGRKRRRGSPGDSSEARNPDERGRSTPSHDDSGIAKQSTSHSLAIATATHSASLPAPPPKPEIPGNSPLAKTVLEAGGGRSSGSLATVGGPFSQPDLAPSPTQPSETHPVTSVELSSTAATGSRLGIAGPPAHSNDQIGLSHTLTDGTGGAVDHVKATPAERLQRLATGPLPVLQHTAWRHPAFTDRRELAQQQSRTHHSHHQKHQDGDEGHSDGEHNHRTSSGSSSFHSSNGEDSSDDDEGNDQRKGKQATAVSTVPDAMKCLISLPSPPSTSEGGTHLDALGDGFKAAMHTTFRSPLAYGTGHKRAASLMRSSPPRDASAPGGSDSLFFASIASADGETRRGLQAALAALPNAPRHAVYDPSSCPFPTDDVEKHSGDKNDATEEKTGVNMQFHTCIQRALTQQALSLGRAGGPSDTVKSSNSSIGNGNTPAAPAAATEGRAVNPSLDALLNGTTDLVVMARRALKTTHPPVSTSTIASEGKEPPVDGTSRGTVQAKVAALSSDEDFQDLRAILHDKRVQYDSANEAMWAVVERQQEVRKARREKATEALRMCETSAEAFRAALSRAVTDYQSGLRGAEGGPHRRRRRGEGMGILDGGNAR